MWSAQTILPAGQAPGPLAPLSTKFAAYALGWGLRDYHGRKLIGHTGASPVSFFASCSFRRKSRCRLLTNAEQGGAFDAILYHILDHYLALPPPTGSPRQSRKR